ncbi:hypothetical protein LIA77_00736 [Sarocladium implicatum]|nr:hypothetical protein LIA77_00736 [Sarocladium implicatum]
MTSVDDLDNYRVDRPIYRGVRFSLYLGFFVERAEHFSVTDLVVIDRETGEHVEEGVFDRGEVTVRPRRNAMSDMEFWDATFWETGSFKITVHYKHYVQRNAYELAPKNGHVSTRVTVTEQPDEESQESQKQEEDSESDG